VAGRVSLPAASGSLVGMNHFKDAGHLLRFAGLFVIAFLVFWVIRGYVVPKSFGQYGHYRGAAIDEIAAHPIKYAGHEACETCHSDIAETKNKGKHEGLNCEACHGALAAHAADPTVTPVKLDTAVLCVRCHSASAARPKNFPQVAAEEHSNGVPCETCHQPHSPAIADSSANASAPSSAPAAAAGGAQ
jgi:hypothetical protein